VGGLRIKRDEDGIRLVNYDVLTPSGAARLSARCRSTFRSPWTISLP
jgi:hypothetical protein